MKTQAGCTRVARSSRPCSGKDASIAICFGRRGQITNSKSNTDLARAYSLRDQLTSPRRLQVFVPDVKMTCNPSLEPSSATLSRVADRAR